MFEATCHCGNIAITAQEVLESITSCNCSMCYRIGALWAYYTAEQVSIEQKSNAGVYQWGNRLRRYHSCSLCGCTTHYTQKREDGTNRVALNTRMAHPELFKTANIRHFDGANTFNYAEPRDT